MKLTYWIGLAYAFLATVGLQTARAVELKVNPTSVSADSSEGGGSIAVTSDSAWTIGKNVSWITLGASGGSGNATVRYSYTANAATTSRSGKITVKSGSLSRTCTITQAGRSAPSQTNIGFPSSAWLSQFAAFSSWKAALFLSDKQDFTYDPVTEFKAGASPYLKFAVYNHGQTTIKGTWKNRVEIRNAAGTVIWYDTIPFADPSGSLAPNAAARSGGYPLDLSMLPVGPYTLRMSLASEATFSDVDLSDNEAEIAFTITGDSVKVTFDGNGADSLSTKSKTVVPGKPYGTLATATKQGSVLLGWFTAKSGGVQRTATDTVTNRTTHVLYAHWTAGQYKITFGKNGGTGGDNYVTATVGQKPHDITVPTKSGYVFDGYWTTTGTGGVQYYGADGKATRTWDTTSAVTLWAKWKKPTYKVTFGKNGGTGGDNSVMVSTGSTPPDVTVPTKAGAVFGGYWTTCGATGVQYYGAAGKATRAYDKSSDVTLWAKWTNRLTFGKNGGTGGDNYVTAVQGQVPHKVTPPTRSGYVFDGYWTTVNNGVEYFTADGQGTRAWSGTKDVTLWAKWVAGTGCKVTLGLNGGTGGAYVYAAKGQAMPRITPPTRAGYTFAGYWTTVNAGGVKYYNADGTSARNWDKSAATTLWAKWTKNSANVVVAKASHGGEATSLLFRDAPDCLCGLLADGTGTYNLLVDADGETGFAHIGLFDGGSFAAEVEIEWLDDRLIVVTADGDAYELVR